MLVVNLRGKKPKKKKITTKKPILIAMKAHIAQMNKSQFQ